ncbi:hypothetical protein BCR44DRAFT_1497890 [Catenaria anguillulae PL171]|uniref:Mitochondrial DNA polymerase catalytic subunit n=1 Tax=Catenaria anguillulae PL171 TaxID=765915 RepID=A0A1Y2HVB5_9FUNG|nr:hypothetical protein BCR44DRAFT_1497890 [Catenaria anguillulae PL171]
MLSSSLHKQVFPHASSASSSTSSASSVDPHAIAISHAHLNQWQLDISNSTELPNVHLPLPPLQGPTIAHHFERLGQHYAQPTLDLIDAWLAQPGHPPLADDPATWLMLPGWTRYDPIDGSPTPVPYPDGPVVVFDVETCPKLSRYPVMATALTGSAWYAWVSPWLIRAASSSSSSDPRANSQPQPGAADLIPLGPHAQIVIGHNVSYDRACVLEEYSIRKSTRVWLDTLSLHVATNGMSSQQRPDFDKVQRVLKKAATERAKAAAAQLAPDHTTGNGLAACAKFYLGVDLEKSTRDAFVDAESADPIVADFNSLMHYCATDVLTTANVFRKVFPQFRQKCPHPVSFVGQAAMGSCFLPVNDQWPKFIAQCDERVKAMVDEIEEYLVMLAHMTVDMVIDRSAAVNLYEGEGGDENNEFPLSGYLPEGLKLRQDVLESNPWLAQLNWECKPLRITKKGLPYKNQKLPNYPDATWLGFPLIHSDRDKWGYMIVFKSGSADYIVFQRWIDQGYRFFKLPHPDGDAANAGNPFTKAFAQYFADGTLQSAHPQAKQALELQLLASYWISRATAFGLKAGRKHWGMILPQMQVMGTITRRAVENTWLTASNAKKGRLGSDVKRHVVAPPGYALVGADVDSEELWISSVMGDAQFGEHGATALGWMTLQGTKAHGTDLHSAKQFNYARIYGAGEAFATGTLRQHNRELSMEEATRKAKTLYEKTKGLKSSTLIAGDPRTPVLGCQIPNSLMRQNCGSSYLTSRINWVVQSSGVDYLHLLIVAMQYLIDTHKIDARLLITIHDEIRYMVHDEDKYRGQRPVHHAHQSHPIPAGESLDIYGLLAKGDQAMLIATKLAPITGIAQPATSPLVAAAANTDQSI